MKLRLLAGAALAAALAGSGAIAADGGWYGAIDIGGHHLQGIEVQAPVVEDTFNDRIRSVDWDGFVRLGYRITPHVRVELEGGYRHGSLHSVHDVPTTIGNDIDVCATG